MREVILESAALDWGEGSATQDPTPILLRRGTISGSLSSLESLTSRVIGSRADPFSQEAFWSRVDGELSGGMLGAELGHGVSGMDLELDPIVQVGYTVIGANASR